MNFMEENIGVTKIEMTEEKTSLLKKIRLCLYQAIKDVFDILFSFFWYSSNACCCYNFKNIIYNSRGFP